MIKTITYSFFMLFFASLLLNCNDDTKGKSIITGKKMQTANDQNFDSHLDSATLGAGCFWCVEAVFQELEGVQKVVSGYSGGHIVNPSYKDVCTGQTGHAEVCRVYYDSSVISFDEILEAFWSSHDPTTLNRQGNDEGTQYRSVIFYHNEKQKEIAEKYKAKLNSENTFGKAVVTEISKLSNFYIAEDYHQNYFKDNPNQAYCSFVISPKVEKFRKVFKHKLKKQ